MSELEEFQRALSARRIVSRYMSGSTDEFGVRWLVKKYSLSTDQARQMASLPEETQKKIEQEVWAWAGKNGVELSSPLGRGYLMKLVEQRPKHHITALTVMSGSTYKEYVDRKKAEGEEPLSQEAWKARVEVVKSEHGLKADVGARVSKKYLEDMESLLKKVEDADSGAKKKFDKAYDKLFEVGEKSAKEAKSFLSKLKGMGAEDVVGLIEGALRDWERNKVDHHQAAESFSAAKKLHQARNTSGYSQKLDGFVRSVHEELRESL